MAAKLARHWPLRDVLIFDIENSVGMLASPDHHPSEVQPGRLIAVLVAAVVAEGMTRYLIHPREQQASNSLRPDRVAVEVRSVQRYR